MRRWIWTLALTAACVSTTHAQFSRQLPLDGKLGELVGQQHPLPLIEIDKKVLRLAPGGRIYDQHNRMILHSHLPEKAQVLFVLDMNGDIARTYILRPEEWDQLKPPPAPAKP